MGVRSLRTYHFFQSGRLKIFLQTLRVQDIFPNPIKIFLNMILKLLFPEKSVLSSASLIGKAFDASLTVEAAMVLPIFIFFAVTLMQPMMWLDDQRKLQTVTEILGEELSQAMYLESLTSGTGYGEGNDGAAMVPAGSTASKSAPLTMTDVAAGTTLKLLTMEFVDDVVIKTSKLSDENGDIRLEAFFLKRPPFAGFFSPGVVMSAGTLRRPFTGLDGKLKAGGSDSAGDDGDETMVFVGKNMTRYHLFRDCHYISNDYRTMSESQAKQEKNSSGSFYRPCSICASKGDEAAVVYVTPSGSHYHRDPDCKSMISYVKTVPLKEVEYLGCCSYCARKKDS